MKPLGIVFWCSLLGAILLVANVIYFMEGIHRPFTWAFIVADVLYLIIGLLIFGSFFRRRKTIDIGSEIDPH